jgi:hypothetical protein
MESVRKYMTNARYTIYMNHPKRQSRGILQQAKGDCPDRVHSDQTVHGTVRWEAGPLKSTVARDCRPLVFFHESTPYGSLIHIVIYFQIRFRICGYIRICMCISAVGYSADSNFV